MKELNVNFIQLKQQQETRDVLEQAKQALIGYAVSYPDHHPGMGPGILPCPDRNKDGSAVANCSFSGQTTIGRFPWRTMDFPQPRDSHGETLWYVVSDNFRTPPVGAINSETPGNLSVDNITDIVAVIIAPGAPVGNQERDPAETDVLNEISNYLEGDNANLDALFVSIAAGDFNDQIIFITRQELMFAVEKRVLGEVFQTLDTYRTDHSAYPWLSPFTDPAASAFRAQLDDTTAPKTGWQGHLPFHWSNDPLSITNDPVNGIANRSPFSTLITVSWNDIANADTSVNNWYEAFLGFSTVTEDCLNNIDCTDANFPQISSLSSPSELQCTWTDRDTADCDGLTVSRTTTYQQSPFCATGTLTRIYSVNFPVFTGTAVINDPTGTDIRTRDVSIDTTTDASAFLPSQTSAIQITDMYSGEIDLSAFGLGCWLISNLVVGTGTSTFDADTDGIITTGNIHYDVDIDDNELPEWFVDNEWHNLIYIAYAEGEEIPGGPTPCSTDVANPNYPCLTINGAGTPNNNSRGIIISAGNIIVTIPQDRSSPSDITQYFEEQNSDQDQVYQASSLYDLRAALESANPVNDQVKVLATP